MNHNQETVMIKGGKQVTVWRCNSDRAAYELARSMGGVVILGDLIDDPDEEWSWWVTTKETAKVLADAGYQYAP